MLIALKPFTKIIKFSEKAFASQFVNDVKKCLLTRFDGLRDDEIKELDKDIIRDTLKLLKDYLDFIDMQSSDQIVEIYELTIAQKYLRSPFFEKRVRGINDLRDIYHKVKNASKGKTAQSMGLPQTRWLTY